MTKTSWKLIGLVLVATALLVLAGCTNAGAGGDGGGGGTETVTQTAEEAFYSGFNTAMAQFGQVSGAAGTSGCMTWAQSVADDGSVTTTLTFNNCEVPDTPIRISGRITIEDEETNLVFGGEITLTNSSVSSIAWDFTYFDYGGGGPVSLEGTVTVDGTDYFISAETGWP
jgi:hypothetical protein